MAFGKRQLVLAALVVALGTAVYLNWQFSSNKELIATNSVNRVKDLGEAQFVNSQVEGEAKQENENNQEEKQEEQKTQYFSEAKKNRQKARDESTEMIKDILSDATASDAAKTEAIKQAAGIAKVIQDESNIESLIKAKGFAQCLVFIHNDECSVVVNSGGLGETSAIAIKDIVSTQGGIAPSKIKILEAKE